MEAKYILKSEHGILNKANFIHANLLESRVDHPVLVTLDVSSLNPGCLCGYYQKGILMGFPTALYDYMLFL